MVAHSAIDAGASVVLGTHAHLIQGIERYKDGIICYGLGNFNFSEFEYDIVRDGTVSRQSLPLFPQRKKSIGVEFAFQKRGKQLLFVKAYQLDESSLPHEVRLGSLMVNSRA